MTDNNLPTQIGNTEEEQEALLHRIALQNKDIIPELRDNIEYLERLQYLTTDMKLSVLRSTDYETLGIALRLSTHSLISSMLKDLTSSIRAELIHFCTKKYPISQVMQAQAKVVDTIKNLEAKNIIVLDASSYDKLV